MDTDIATDIKAIKRTIERGQNVSYSFLALIAITFLSTLIYDTYFKDKFYEKASDLFERGKYAELRELTDKRKVTNPNDPYIYWFLARAEYLDGHRDLAIKNLQMVKRISPSWDKDYVKPMEEILQDQTFNQALKAQPSDAGDAASGAR